MMHAYLWNVKRRRLYMNACLTSVVQFCQALCHPGENRLGHATGQASDYDASYTCTQEDDLHITASRNLLTS